MSNVFVVFDKTFYDTNYWLIVLHACDDMSEAIFDRLKIPQFLQMINTMES